MNFEEELCRLRRPRKRSGLSRDDSRRGRLGTGSGLDGLFEALQASPARPRKLRLGGTRGEGR